MDSRLHPNNCRAGCPAAIPKWVCSHQFLNNQKSWTLPHIAKGTVPVVVRAVLCWYLLPAAKHCFPGDPFDWPGLAYHALKPSFVPISQAGAEGQGRCLAGQAQYQRYSCLPSHPYPSTACYQRNHPGLRRTARSEGQRRIDRVLGLRFSLPARMRRVHPGVSLRQRGQFRARLYQLPGIRLRSALHSPGWQITRGRQFQLRNHR